MHIVLVTTKVAKKLVEDIVSRIALKNCKVTVVSLEKIPVAALATTTEIAKELIKYKDLIRGADLILVPGLVLGSTKVIEEYLGVKTFKGSKYAGDIPTIIEYLLNGGELSTERPADEIIPKYLETAALSKLSKMMLSVEAIFEVRGIKFVKKPPPINLFHEVVVRKSNVQSIVNEVVPQLVKYEYQGVVLGCEVGTIDLNALMSIAREISSNYKDLLLGIDAPLKKLVSSPLINHVDVIMNVSLEEAELLKRHKRDLEDKVIVLAVSNDTNVEKVINTLRDLGLNKIVVDAVVRPPLLGFADSVIAYNELARKANVPLMMGLSNIYELIDADTHGVIITCMTLGFELGVSNMLTTEESTKAIGSIKEAHIARRMLYIAYARRSPPINVGPNLLIVKDKRRKSEKPPETKAKVININKYVPPRLDERYFLRIYLDLDRKEIVVDVHQRSNNAVILRFTGKDALSLGRSIVRSLKLDSEHAIYLGCELKKAEIALKLKKSYVQDEPLFFFSYID